MAGRSGICINISVFLSTGVLIFGLFGFVIFGFYEISVQAAAWAFFSALYSCLVIFISALYKTHRLELWYTPQYLRRISYFGILGTMASITALVAYVAVALYHKESLPTVSDLKTSHFVMAFWTLFTLESSGLLFLCCYFYSKNLCIEYHGFT